MTDAANLSAYKRGQRFRLDILTPAGAPMPPEFFWADGAAKRRARTLVWGGYNTTLSNVLVDGSHEQIGTTQGALI